MSFPKSDIENGKVLASDLAGWYWCAEKCYHSCRGIKEPPKEIFAEGHAVEADATRPPEKPDEKEFFGKLQSQMPIYREAEGIKIFAGTDAFNLSELKDGIVRLVEIKSRGKPQVPQWALAPAEFQLEIYAWVYKPIIEKLGYKFPDTHYLIFIHRETRRIIHTFQVTMDYGKIEEKIADTLRRVKAGEGIIRPKDWKCSFCDDSFKRVCRFR